MKISEKAVDQTAQVIGDAAHYPRLQGEVTDMSRAALTSLVEEILSDDAVNAASLGIAQFVWDANNGNRVMGDAKDDATRAGIVAALRRAGILD